MKLNAVLVMALLVLTSLFVGCSEEQTEQIVAPKKSWSEIKSTIASMPENERPQFILVTFDDALHSVAYDYTDKIITKGHTNPNGAPVPLVYYVSNEYTDYHLVQQRYAQGCEIAVHTMTHTTSKTDSYDKWRAEIVGCRNTLSELAGIPKEKINGFRAPFLAHSDNSFRVLWEEGFLYESSITEQIGNNSKDVTSFIFPYTFDSLGTQDCSVGECPQQEYPGLWEIPMWGWHNESGQLIANMDPPGGYSEILTMFNETFDTRYNSNRAPIGIFLHPGWLSEDAHANAINDFLTRSLGYNGVWVVTGQQLIEWMKDPKPISQMNSFEAVQYVAPASGPEVADGWDNDGDGDIDEGFVNNCSYAGYNFRTTADQCPDEYPSPEISVSKWITASVEGDLIGSTECSDSAWVRGKSYPGGSIVSHNGHTWSAKWYESSEPGASEWSGWVDGGECASDIYEYNGTITPVGKVRVQEYADTFFVITPNSGYRISDVLVDGTSVGAKDTVYFNRVTVDHTVVAQFEEDDNAVYYDITASAGANGTISPNGTTSVREGQSQSYTIAANSGYRIADVTVNGSSVGKVTSYAFDNVTAAQTIAATFEVIPTFTVDVAQYTNGTVTPGDKTLEEGSSVTYTFTANSGYRIANVVVNGTSQGAITEYTISSIAENYTIAPTFELIPLVYDTVHVTASTGGTVTGDTVVLRSTDASFTIAPNAGYRIVDVVLDGASQGSVTSVSIPAISANHSLNVTFEVIPTFTVSASAGANGSISPVGDTVVEEGTNLSYAITAAAGYRIADVTVDGVSQGAVSSVVLSNVAANHTVAATFELIPVVYYNVTVQVTGNGSASTDATFTIREGNDTTITFTPDAGYRIGTVVLNGADQGAVSSITLSNVSADQSVAVSFEEETGSICDGVAAWDANTNWTSYSIGDRRVNDGKVWEVTVPHYAFYEPSSSWGYLGWSEVGSCN